MKIGEYYIFKTDTGTIVIAHESGEAMEILEEMFIAMLREFWEDNF